MNLTEVKVGGVGETLQKEVVDGTTFKGIKAHFAIDLSGIVRIASAEVIVEQEPKPEPEGRETTLESIVSFQNLQQPRHQPLMRRRNSQKAKNQKRRKIKRKQRSHRRRKKKRANRNTATRRRRRRWTRRRCSLVRVTVS